MSDNTADGCGCFRSRSVLLERLGGLDTLDVKSFGAILGFSKLQTLWAHHASIAIVFHAIDLIDTIGLWDINKEVHHGIILVSS